MNLVSHLYPLAFLIHCMYDARLDNPATTLITAPKYQGIVSDDINMQLRKHTFLLPVVSAKCNEVELTP